MTEKPSRNEDEYFVKRDNELLREQRTRLEAEQAAAERRTHYMKCPKDGYDLATQTHQKLQVDVCTHCGGVWLDPGELDQVSRQSDPGLVGRLVGDLFTSLRGGQPRSEPGTPAT